MADILKVTTPLVNRNMMPNTRTSTDPSIPFQLVDTSSTKVTKLHDHKEMLAQNNTLQLNSDSSSILTGMLNDPNSSVQFLRSIYLLQEVVNMLPIANDVISEEIVTLYESLLVKPENMVEEMLRQDLASTVFRGELFDTLRQILSDIKVMLENTKTSGGNNTPANQIESSSLDEGNPLSSSSSSSSSVSSSVSSSPFSASFTLNDVKFDISSLMKAMNQVLAREDILESISNHLTFLANEYDGLKMGSRLSEMSESFHVLSEMVSDNVFNKDAMNYFNELKNQLMTQINEMKQSLIYSPKIAKNISIMQYNLSRLGFGEEYLNQSLENIMRYIETPEDQAKFKQLVEQYLIDRHLEMSDSAKLSSSSQSRVMNALTEILVRESSGKHIMTQDQIEKIVQTLLTSPSNFTPLLHFVLPLDYHGLKSFGEMWIDPNSEGETQSSDEKKKLNAHVLMALDVDHFGRFEIEAKIIDQNINLTVYCPKFIASEFNTIKDDLTMILLRSPFKQANVSITSLERPRTLMEVFKNLPSRRTGINVSI